MTEVEWLRGRDPAELIRGLPDDPGTDRKLLLWSVVCCRLHPRPELGPKEAKEVEGRIAVVERFADGGETLAAVREEWGQRVDGQLTESPSMPEQPREWAVVLTGHQHIYLPRAEKVRLLREIFGNPFRPLIFDSAWRTGDVMLLATGIYSEKAFDRMPILADALQDAGCDSDDLLSHCRDTSATHVRGCWALDLVLEKG